MFKELVILTSVKFLLVPLIKLSTKEVHVELVPAYSVIKELVTEQAVGVFFILEEFMF